MSKITTGLITALIIIFNSADIIAQHNSLDSLINKLEAEGYKTEKEGYTNLVKLFYLRLGDDFEKSLNWVNANINDKKLKDDEDFLCWNKAFLAVILEHTGESAKANENLRSTLKTAQNLKNKELIGFIEMNLGNLYSHSGKYDVASSFLKKADIKLSGSSPYFRFLSKFNRIVFFNEWNYLDSASIELQQLEPLMQDKRMGFYSRHFEYLSLLASMNKVTLKKASSEIDFILKNSVPKSIIYLLAFQTKVGISYRSGDFPELIKNYSTILNDFEVIDKLGQFNRAKLFLGLAEGYDSQGQHDLAFQFVNKAMKLAMKGNYQVLIGKCHLELAWLNFALQDLNGAERELNLAENIFQQTNERYSITDALNLLAQIRQKQDRKKEALELHEQCLDSRSKLNDPFLISSSLYNIGIIKSNKQEFREALDYFRQGIKVDILRGDSYGICQYQLEMAIAFRGLNQKDSTFWYLDQAVRLAGSAGAAEVLRSCYSLLSEIYEENGNLAQGIAYLKKYLSVQDQLSQSESKMSLEAYKTLAELNSKEKEIEQITEIRNQQEALVKTQQLLLYFMVGGVIVSIIVALTYFRLGRKLRRLSESNIERANLLSQQKVALESALSDLKKAQDQLILSEKMASLGVMSMGIAHELNNPLNFIKGGLMGLKSELKNLYSHSEKVNKFITVIDEGVQRSALIIKGISHYSHTSEKVDEDCDAHLTLDNCLLIIENKLQNRITIEKKFSSNPMILKGNSGKFHQALLNLLVNAEQAIVGTGKIKLTTISEEKNKQIIIEDTGCGIPEQNLKRLGDLFFTTKEPGKGTGFGLSLCYKVIREMGGEIKVESVVGKGTTFILSF